MACPTRAMRFNDDSLCIHCCACINVCPSQALEFTDERFLKTVDKLESNCLEIKETKYY
jgi:ferredoxin